MIDPQIIEAVRAMDLPTAGALVNYADTAGIPPSWEGDLNGTAVEVVKDDDGALVCLTRACPGGLMGVQLTDRCLLALATMGARFILGVVQQLEPEIDEGEEIPPVPRPT